VRLCCHLTVLTDHWQPVAPASGWVTVMQRNLNTALPVTVLCVGWSVGCSSWERSAVGLHPIGLHNTGSFWNYRSASHRPIVLTDTIDYRTIGFSHNRPNPNAVSSLAWWHRTLYVLCKQQTLDLSECEYSALFALVCWWTKSIYLQGRRLALKSVMAIGHPYMKRGIGSRGGALVESRGKEFSALLSQLKAVY